MPTRSARSWGSPSDCVIFLSQRPVAFRSFDIVRPHRSAYGRDSETEPPQHRDLAALHAARIGGALVVVADEMQRAVHDEVRPVRAQALALLARFGAQHVRADDQVAQRCRLGRIRTEDRQRRRRKRQHVGRMILAAVAGIEPAAFRARPRLHADLAVAGAPPERGVGPGGDGARPRETTCARTLRSSTCAPLISTRSALRRLSRCAGPADGAPRPAHRRT